MRNTALSALWVCAALSAAVSAEAMLPGAPVPATVERPFPPVILDPGHGGDDLGAVVKGVREKDVALAMALKLRARLTRGAELPVLLTRDGDFYVPLDRRVVDSVDWSGAVFVSLHLNQVKSKKMTGAVIYTYGPEKRRAWRRKRHPSVPPMPAPPRGQTRESEALSHEIVRALRGDGVRAKTAKSDYYVLKNPAQPSVLVELGYLSNPDEHARLIDPAYQERLVEALAKAIEGYAESRALGSYTAAR